MLDRTIDMSNFESQISQYLNNSNSQQVKQHIQHFKKLLLSYPLLLDACKPLMNDLNSITKGEYWLQLEILAGDLEKEDDVLARRCLFHFASTIENNPIRPSSVNVFDRNIDLLRWYRKSYRLGCELHEAINKWDKESPLSRSTTRVNAQKAQQCLKLLCDSAPKISKDLYENGLLWFKSVNHFREIFKENPIEDKHCILQSSLLAVLQTYKPEHFKIVEININGKKIDVTELAEIDQVLVEQLQKIANSPKYTGELEHEVDSMTRRFISSITSIRKILKREQSLTCKGLDNFKANKFALLKQAKILLRNYEFNELLLLLEAHFEHEINRHDYIDHLLSFYFKKEKKYRLIDYSEIASICPSLMIEIEQFHQSETELLPQKNYDMETLHSRFQKLKRLIIKYILPSYELELIAHGLSCLGLKNNRIQKAVFQQIQSDVKGKVISLRSGISFIEVVRWLMKYNGQEVVEVFKISFKRYQRHARRLRIEDLYSDDELRELVFYVEKGIKDAKDTKQLLVLYFARIQLKSCWNTSPMTDIELSDIAEVSLPTAKKSITLLIQKPRKGYDVDTYSLDGRAVNSVMRDIVYVRDTLTNTYRHLAEKDEQKYLFITKERTNVTRVITGNIIKHIKCILNRLGCRVDYNSMRIRKNGTNHLYREVAKQMKSYESAKLHTFDTFIKHYQRVSEEKTQQTLHTAVDVMQRYFTGREIDPEIKILMVDNGNTQKTPTGECASNGNDPEALQYVKEHRHLSEKKDGAWCSDFLACVWCKHFRTVADPEHVWQLLSYRDYVLADMSASVSDIENNEFQQEAIEALKQRVDTILNQVATKNMIAVTKGKELMEKNGMHPYWAFAVTSAQNLGEII